MHISIKTFTLNSDYLFFFKFHQNGAKNILYSFDIGVGPFKGGAV